MIITLINFTGNVGKSTLTNQLFRPRLRNKNYSFFSIETLNDSDAETMEKRRGQDYNNLYEEILLDHDNAVIDVGASNVESFMQKMNSNVGSHEDFDLFVLPIIPDTQKQMQDTVNTIASLNVIGVPAKKIVLVFNQVQDEFRDIEEQFPEIFLYHQAKKNFTLDKNLVIYDNEAFRRVSNLNTNIYDLANSNEDFKALANGEKLTREQKHQYILLHSTRGQAKSANDNLDNVFNILHKKYKF